MTDLLTPSAMEPATSPLTAESAVSACSEAYTRLHLAAKKGNRGRYEANEIAADAYCRALPRLSSLENVRAFIACVAHGLAIGVIEGSRASRLLYAAQVAKSAFTQTPTRCKKIIKNPEPSAS